MNKIINLIKNNFKSLFFYGVFGVLTTLVNIGVYYLFKHIWNWSTTLSTIIAWIIAVLFAFFTNKQLVFKSNNWSIKLLIKELLSFIVARLFTFGVEILSMYIFVDILLFNDMIIKLIVNILVIILNFILSKLIVFNKKRTTSD